MMVARATGGGMPLDERKEALVAWRASCETHVNDAVPGSVRAEDE